MSASKQVVDLSRGGTVKVMAVPASAGASHGVETIWELTPAKDNLHARYVAPAQRARLAATKVKGTREGWANTVTLPHVGGDAYTLRARAPGPGGELLKELELVTTRRLPVVVYHVDDVALGVWREALPHLKAALEAVGVTLDDSTPPVKTDVVRLELNRGPDKQATMVGELGKLFKDGALPPSPVPGALRVFLLQHVHFRRDGQFTWKVSSALAQELHGKPRRLLPPGFENWLPDDAVVASTLALTKPPPRRTIDMRPRTRIIDKKGVAFHFDTAFVVEHLRGGSTRDDPVGTLTLEVEAIEAGLKGYADGKNLIAVATRAERDQPLGGRLVARIAAHEIGHALGQVVKTRKIHPGGSERNKKHYEGHGGIGHHCRTNTRIEERVESQRKVKVLVHDKGPLCLMYHDALDSNLDGSFCPDCTIGLRLADLREGGALRRTWLA
ncbi:MAG: hypothetical protein KIT58_17960 [Planctomycetota bacterium]|nr:hypothetical protein [Planctomycetota bacterium]